MRPFLLLICLSYTLLVRSQENMPHDKTTYLAIHLGLSGMTVYDRLVMPRHYSGTNALYGAGYRRDKARSHQEFNILGTIGQLSADRLDGLQNNARFKEPKARLYYMKIDYSWLHEVQKKERQRIYLGAAADIFINARFSTRWDNSSINYEGSIAPLIVQGRIERDLTIRKKDLSLGFRLQVPAIMYVMRPPFSGVPDFLDHESDFITQFVSKENSDWVGIWDFPNVRTRLDLKLPIRGTNAILFSYGWEYYSYQKPLKTQLGGHTYLFTLLTHL